jgi:predicted dinucleotide-binding enzyme
LAAGLTTLGHDVMVGTRAVAAALSRSDPGPTGDAPFAAWHAEHAEIQLGTHNQAAAHGEVLVNATNGAGALAALTAAGPDNLAGKAVLDISNPLDFSSGMPQPSS